MCRQLGWVLFSLALVPGAANVELGLYPWTGDLDSRSEELLADLRSRSFLDLDTKVFLSFRDLPVMRLIRAQVVPEVVHREQRVKLEEQEVWAVRALPESDAHLPMAPTPVPTTPPPTDYKRLQSLLKGKCLAYNTDPPTWWTTEWCHRCAAPCLLN